MGNYNFKKDLEVSHSSVNKVCKFLHSKGAIDIFLCNNKDYDIRCTLDGMVSTVEVKEDFMYSKTGNVAIEISSRNKPSGLYTSKADLWFYVLGEDLYACWRKDLLGFMSENSWRTVEGGDNNTSVLYLVPLDAFKYIFTKINLVKS